MKIGILIDSSATAFPEIFKNTVVEVIPLHLSLAGGVEFLDTPENAEKYKVLELIEQNKEVKTSQASPGELEEKYDEMLKKYDHIIHIPITQNLSSMLQTAQMVASDDKYKDTVSVFFNDNMTATIIEKLAFKINEGLKNGSIASLEETLNFIKICSEESFVSFVPGDLKRISAGGRAKTVLASVLSLLKVKVLIRWGRNPKKEAICRTFGSATEKVVEIFKKEFSDKYQFLFLRSEKLLSKNLKIIREILGSNNIEFEEIVLPNVYSAHAGTDSLAFLFFKK